MSFFISTILAFKDNCATFQRLHAMPLTGLNRQSHNITACNNGSGVCCGSGLTGSV